MNQVDNDKILKYKEALFNASLNRNLNPLKSFKASFPNEFKLLDGMTRKRKELRKELDAWTIAAKKFNQSIYWFTLTFNNDKDTNDIKTKRKNAHNFLNNIALMHIMVEEYGDDNQRYHIHGFLMFKYMYGFDDFTQWHSRQNIVELDSAKLDKKIYYLTKYMSKQVPRLRRSKMAQKIHNYANKYNRFKKCFPKLFEEDTQNLFANLAFDV